MSYLKQIIIDPLWLQTVSKRSLEIAQVLVLNQRSVNYTVCLTTWNNTFISTKKWDNHAFILQKSDESPLHKAIHYNCKEIAALLISNGANIEATNKLVRFANMISASQITQILRTFPLFLKSPLRLTRDLFTSLLSTIAKRWFLCCWMQGRK
jgi:ankyrin repeat protein